MQEINIIKIIKKVFTNKIFLTAFLTSLLSVLLVFLIVFSLAWNNRAQIFGYFAREYLKDAQGGSERILEKETIFTQEHFVVDAVKKANPAVVSIIISKEVPKYEAYIN